MVGTTADDFVAREKARIALDKLITFDVQLVLDTFISSLVIQVDNAQMELRTYSESLQEKVAEKTKQLKELSLRDNLSGLFNQRAFFENLRRELGNAERYHESITLFYFDLNGFKALNDSEGHQAGDKVLSIVGDVVKAAIRETDIGCRYGGDEFCIILPRTSIQTAEIVRERLIKEFKDRATNSVSFSLGIVDTGPEEFLDYESFIKIADEEMYKAKAESKKSPGIHVSVYK
jgi:diguanylate cyclase (GGDEF)-like protein